SSTVVNWGTITSTSSAGSCAGLCNTITVGEVFEFRDSSNRLLSRVGVPATVPNMTSFVIPRFRNITTGLDVGFAIANTGTASTTVTVNLSDASGNVLASQQITLGPQSQMSKFSSQVFPNLSDATGYYALNFIGTGPQLAAIGLAIEGSSLATLPVDQL